MIKLENIKLNHQQVKLDLILNEGVYFIEDSILFSFLKFKKSPKEGNLFIDGFNIFVDQNSKFLMLDVNSKVMCLSACFLSDDKFNQDKLINDLNSLKDMSINNINEISKKISSILRTLISNHVSYLLLDFNNEINKEYRNTILKLIGFYDENTLIIILEKKLETQLPQKSENIKENKEKNNTNKNKPNKIKKLSWKVKKPNFREFFKFIKVDNIQYLFLSLESLIAVFLSFLCPYYLSLNDKLTLGIVSLDCIVLLFAFSIYFNYSIYSIALKRSAKENRNLNKNYLYIWSVIFSLIGSIISIVIMIIFYNKNILIRNKDYNELFFISPSIMTVLFALLTFVSPFIEFIKNKINTKKHK